ncbi:hypothetical protein [uncultured Tessaracoccus sp.]|uniref:hypothetical protein n=1 Tax=uncultured Tessaracoccus sp. TaxID=905023 RepID=UPI0025D1CF15|nr:hypothetical protein [uncultured Tessaracoccus sp.]
MTLRTAALACATLLLAACAPTPGGTGPAEEPSTSAPAATESPASAEPEPTATTEPPSAPASEGPEPSASPSNTPSGTPSATPSTSREPTATPSASGTTSARPAGKGWTVIDAKVTKASDVDGLPVNPKVAHYLKSRMGEPCELTMTVFAAHADGYLVADEQGICDGARLFVYGMMDGDVEELVEFSSAQPCGKFAQVGLPKGVPATKLFRDGLACTAGGKVTRY